MKHLLTCLAVLCLVSLSATAAVTFNDSQLKAAVETKLGLADPNEAEMLTLTELDAGSLGITDLTGLEYATNLKNLYLHDNPINDADINTLSVLTKLRFFKVTDCNITDINVVSNFTALLGFSAGNNNIADLSPLQNLNFLKYLYVYGNNISNLAPISGLTTLRDLDLGDNIIVDVNAVSNLTNLEYLNIRYNAITDINALDNINSLDTLFVSFNTGLTNISAIADMNSLTELGITATGISDISDLSALTQLEILWLGANNITDISPLLGYSYNLDILDLRYNPLSFNSWCSLLHQLETQNPLADIRTLPDIDDLINNGSTSFGDMKIFSDNWLKTGCDTNNGFCDCADLTDSSNVNFEDFVIFASWWVGN